MNKKLKNALGFVSLKYKESSTCESCGGRFVCGATIKGCWCVEVKTSEQVRAELKSKFRDCLCQSCLEKYGSTGDKKVSP
jgi:hypothetical protein